MMVGEHVHGAEVGVPSVSVRRGMGSCKDFVSTYFAHTDEAL